MALKACTGVLAGGGAAPKSARVGPVRVITASETLPVAPGGAVALDAVVLLMAGSTGADVPLSMKPVEIARCRVEPAALETHRMRTPGGAEGVGGVRQLNRPTLKRVRERACRRDPTSNMARKAEGLDPMAGLAPEVVFTGPEGVLSHPGVWMVAYIAGNTVMTAHAVVLGMAFVAVGSFSLGGNRMVSKEVGVMDCEGVIALGFEHP